MNIPPEEFHKVVEHIKESYGSLEEPNWSFVSDKIDQNPYGRFVARLADIGEVTEDTDDNDDVSFGYYIKKGGQLHSLRLSMVGPYAMLIQPRPGALVSSISDCGSTECEELCRRLAQAGITLLDDEDLTRTVPLKVDEDTPCTVFQALFINSDVLHWRQL